MECCDNFSYLEFYGRDYYDKMRKKIKNKVKRLIWKEHNIEIKKNIDSFISKGLSISENTFSKLEKIVSEFGVLIKDISKTPHELALYLLANKDDLKVNNPIVKDVYIAHKQEVFPSFVNISGAGDILSLKEIRSLNKKIIGWGHSHGMHNTFFSGTDKSTIETFLDDNKTFGSVKFKHYDHSHNYDFGYTFGLVINARKDKPFVALNVEYPEYVVSSDGKIQINSIRKYIDGVKLDLIKAEDYNPTNEENNDLIEKLKNRVIIKGRKLIDQLPKLVEKVKDFDYRSAFNKSKSEYDTLKNDYLVLQTQNKTLENDKLYLELSSENKSYGSQMRDFYSNKRVNGNIKLASKILAGDYRGNLDSIIDGDFSENNKNDYVWTWTDRIKYLEKIDLGDLGYVESKRLKEIIDCNRYLKQKYPEKYEKLTEMLK